MKTWARWKQPELSLRPLAGTVLAVALLCSSAAGFAQAQTQTGADTRGQDKAELIRQLIAMTDAAQLEAVFSRQLINRVASAVAMFRPNMDPATMRIVREEATDVVHERIESGDALYSVLYPVYAKHFDLFELNKLVSFYQSPLGQKLVRISPQLLTESLDLGSQWGLSLVPEIAQRVQERLAEQE